MTTEEILLRPAVILAADVDAQWLAWRLRLPSILLLLVAGSQWIGDPQGQMGQVVISLTMPPESPLEEPARSDR